MKIKKGVYALTQELITQMDLNPELNTPDKMAYLAKMIDLYIAQLRLLSAETEKDLFAIAYRKVDDAVAGMPPGQKLSLSCKKGCSFCCHINVMLYKGEAELISSYCQENNISIDKKYLLEQVRIPQKELLFSKTHSACVFLKDGE
jgi:hypothetical protein